MLGSVNISHVTYDVAQMYKNESQHSCNYSGYVFLLLSCPKFSFVKGDMLEFHFALRKGFKSLTREIHLKRKIYLCACFSFSVNVVSH